MLDRRAIPPYSPALACVGLRPDPVIFVEASSEVLQTLEDCVRCAGLRAVVAEFSGPLGLTSSRRVQLAADASGVTTLMIRRSRKFDDPALDAPSAALTRWRIGAMPSPPVLPDDPGREEFVVLGWTPPGGSRRGIGDLALGFYDPDGALHYVGAVGTGFSDRELLGWRERLEPMRLASPLRLRLAGEAPDRAIRWVRPELLVRTTFTAWSGEGRLRHPVSLGLQEDKRADQVVMAVPNPDAPRRDFKATDAVTQAAPSRSRWHGAVPPLRASAR